MSTARLLLLTSSALAGCAETCPPPQAALDQRSFDVFGRVVALDQDPPPEWPAESMPFNGPHTWTIGWATSGLESPVTVMIDDQVFEGSGNYDDVECGNFSVGFNGTFLGADGAEHLFGAAARMVVWPDGLDGFVSFQSTWVSADEDQGTAAGSAQITSSVEEALATP